MPSLFSRKRGKDGQGKSKSKKNGALTQLTEQLPPKPRWDDAFARTDVEAGEIQDLIRRCTEELKARALDHPFFLLPFRPTSDPSAVRTFIRHFFDGNQNLQGEGLAQELRLTEPMVIAGVLKWCWSRLQGGVVGWDAYELFKVGEQDSNMARDSFSTFIPLSVDDEARSKIIFDFFDLLSAIAAHGKMNGLGGRKLSRMAAWWAFEHKDTNNGFDGGYKAWLNAADATSHLFFAYLRSLAPQPTRGGISMLPRSLQSLLQDTEYPPETPSLMQSSTNRVVMIVDAVSPTPFALLRRANHFQYRDDDDALREFSEYDDPVEALTEECRRVLKAISLANQSQVTTSSKHSTGLRDASWSRFEDMGFAASLDEEDEDGDALKLKQQQRRNPRGLRTTPHSAGGNMGRPTTPSWADFLSSGFVDDGPTSPSNLLLPPDKILPPIDTTIRQRSAQSSHPRLQHEQHLGPGELASITRFDLDDAFWWVWITSLAPEETLERKSAFGRCAVIETVIRGGRWLVMEEMVKGAAPEPEAGAYIAEKKGLFSWTKRGKGLTRRKSTAGKHGLDSNHLKPGPAAGVGLSKTSIGPDQQARIQAAAQQLQAKQQQGSLPERRGRTDADHAQDKTTSVLTLQPVIMKEASPAMKWANKYDKEAIRQAYLANTDAGRGLGQATMQTNGHLAPSATSEDFAPEVPAKSPAPEESPQPAPISEKALEAPRDVHPAERSKADGRGTPLPPTTEGEASRVAMKSPEPGASPESKKHKKLQKDGKKTGGGFRKLFGRNKTRTSKLPENAANDLNAMLAADATAAAPASAPEEQTEAEPTESAVASPTEPTFETPMEHPDETGTELEPIVPEGAADAPLEEDPSPIGTADAAEAQNEFNRFDQGPLAEQPAFVPEDDQSEDEAAPPPIARHAGGNRSAEGSATDDDSAPSPAVPTQNRWARLRQDAANRAHQSEDPGRGEAHKPADVDDISETIESRVARIKARVAELTASAEGAPGPGGRTPPVSRTPPIRR